MHSKEYNSKCIAFNITFKYLVVVLQFRSVLPLKVVVAVENAVRISQG
jgi:hypothetical protein